jgi:primosomal protein N'
MHVPKIGLKVNHTAYSMMKKKETPLETSKHKYTWNILVCTRSLSSLQSMINHVLNALNQHHGHVLHMAMT